MVDKSEPIISRYGIKTRLSSPAMTVLFLDTEIIGKNTIILGDERSTIEITRGMQAITSNLLIAEKRINITTLEK